MDENEYFVIGFTRDKKYCYESVPANLIENVRFQRVFDHKIMEMMDFLEYYDKWWHRTAEDKRDAKRFADEWNQRNENYQMDKRLHNRVMDEFSQLSMKITQIRLTTDLLSSEDTGILLIPMQYMDEHQRLIYQRGLSQILDQENERMQILGRACKLINRLGVTFDES